MAKGGCKMISDLIKALTFKKIDQKSNDNLSSQVKVADLLDDDKNVNIRGLQSKRFEDPETGKMDLDVASGSEDEDKIIQENVASTAIDSVRYDPKKKIMWIRFVGGDKEYAFPNVPKDKIQQFLKAQSKGRFYHQDLAKYSVKGFRQ